MKFSVVVRNSDGNESKETIEAASRLAVYEQVEKGGASVVSLEEKGASLALPAWANISIGSGVKTEQKITFTKNLSAMLGAGLTLSRALSVLGRQAENKVLKRIVAELEDAVKGGASFHEALAAHPKVFPRLFIAMTKAGEEGGKLAETLKVVGKQMETSHQLTKKIKGAMIYPSIILGAIVVIGVLMLIYVVPTLSSTFASLGVDLPRSTKIIVGMSDFAVSHIPIVLGLLLLVAVLIIVFVRSKVGQSIILTVALRFPVIKHLVRETYSARATRTLSSLLSSGVEMLTAIGISAEVVGENRFGKVLNEAEERVKKGEALSATFMEHPKLFPVFVSEMVAVGEETGKLADMLGQVAEYYEQDVEGRTKDLSTIIEPILMLFIGVFVGIFALSMISPIYSLSDKI
ncbi:MAG: type pilus assembly protein PilC [Candidatus Parcubacteria bacterium]|jgi:type IV pilus assembly protein PilC|nr:type pilus assembly protein PilC [Candidatus Parcubacteria bacterium]